MTETIITNPQHDNIIYDRQIRLWGVQAQKKIMESTLLVIGVNTLSAEILKNLVLAGVKLITITTNTIESSQELEKPLTESDLKFNTNFFFTTENIGQKKIEVFCNKVQQLNNKVKVEFSNCKNNLEEVIKKHDLICLTENELDQAKKINKICNCYNKNFIFGSCLGINSIIFIDFNTHIYTKKAGNKDEDKIEKKTEYERLEKCLNSIRLKTKKIIQIKQFGFFCFLICILENPKKNLLNELLKTWNFMFEKIKSNTNNLNKEYLIDRNLDLLNQCVCDLINSSASFCFADFPACASVTGGLIAQEITKAFTSTDQPIENLLCYNGLEADGVIHTLTSS